MSTTGAYALKDAVNLTKLTLSKFMSTPGIGLCHSCSNLTDIELLGNLKNIPDSMFQNCVSLNGELFLPESVQRIGTYAFSGCTGITKYVMSEKTTEIAEGAFLMCSSLSEVKFSNSLITLEGRSFERTAISEAIIPESVSTIGGSVFYGCKNLSSVVLESKSLQFTDSFSFQ